jgi:diacylglycerol kinase
MTAATPTTERTDWPELRRRRPRRRWREKFRDAFRGIKRGVRGHSSFFVHFFFAALAVAAGAVLNCVLWEWCVLLGCIGLVLTAELFNSALETLFHGLDEQTKGRIVGCLDIAAGAVLMASLTAALLGALVIANRLAQIFGWLGG